jgi:hypothetical protein
MRFTRRVPMKRALVTAVAVIGVAALVGPASASPITFTSRSLFDAAAPGLPLENFEAALVSPGGVGLCPGPLSGAAASACFPLGGLLPGVTYNSSPTPFMAVLGAGFPGVGNTSKVLGPNAFLDTFNILFSGSPNAVGFDVFPGLIAGNIAISAFSPTDVLLGTFTIPGPIGGTFFGFITEGDVIGQVSVASQSSSPGELIDNLAFGTTAVPEPASLTLLALGIAGLVARRRATT